MATAVKLHQIVRKTEFAAALGISKARVSQFVKKGMPVREDGLLDTSPALDWLAEHKDIPERVAAAREQFGLSASKMPGDLKPAEVAESGKPLADFIAGAEAQAREQGARIREACRAIPDRIAKQLAAETDEAKVKALIEKEIYRTLNELADILLGPGA